MRHKSLNRVLRAANIAIAVVLLLVAAAVYWFAYRALPQTSGVVRVRLDRPATAARDSIGVPHIRAAAIEDALFVQGYVTAQDRLFQMDGLRRLSGGGLSEIIGATALESDREAHRLRLPRIAADAYTTLSATDRAVFAAYARGVNAYITTHLGRLPLEFRLLGYQPRPWSAVDSILIGLHMYRNLTTTWRSDLLKRQMLARGDRAKVDFLFADRAGTEVQPGSNAWALAGTRTASGKPLLSNDMHLEWSLPGIWYMVHLQAPGLNVAGVSLPGVPGIIVGHNERIAWGVTNLQFDVQDLYSEKLDERTGRYLYKGHVEQARFERDVIAVKDSAPVEVATWITRHGPVLLTEGNEHFSLRWAAAEPGRFQFPFLDLNRATNWQQFTAAVSRFQGPAQNFVYADVDGNIGYHASGLLPIRKGFAGDLPLDGSSDEYEWQGFIPFDQLPSAINPAGGMIVTANQNPFPVSFPYAVHGNFAPPFRSNQIRARLAAKNGCRAAEMLRVQTDVYSAFDHHLARAIVAAWDRKKPGDADLAEAVSLLRSWNGQVDQNLAAPMIAELVYQHFRSAAANSAAPSSGSTYAYQMAPAALEQLLATRPAGWFSDWDQTLLENFRDAVAEGRRMQGRNIKGWKYGNYLALRIPNPVIGRIPGIGSYFQIGPAPMSGAGTSVKQTTLRLGPSMRMNADLSDWDRSLLNIVTGQSGQVLSSHYKDQWERYYAGESYPMQFHNVQAPDVLHFEPAGRR